MELETTTVEGHDTMPTTTQAIDTLFNTIRSLQNCHLTKDQLGKTKAILEIATSMRPSDNDMLHGILIELDEIGIGSEGPPDGDTAVEYLSNLRCDLLLHLGQAAELPLPREAVPAIGSLVKAAAERR